MFLFEIFAFCPYSIFGEILFSKKSRVLSQTHWKLLAMCQNYFEKYIYADLIKDLSSCHMAFKSNLAFTVNFSVVLLICKIEDCIKTEKNQIII